MRYSLFKSEGIFTRPKLTVVWKQMSVVYPTKLLWLARGQLCGQQWPLLCGEHQNLDQMVAKVMTLNLNVGLESRRTHIGAWPKNTSGWRCGSAGGRPGRWKHIQRRHWSRPF